MKIEGYSRPLEARWVKTPIGDLEVKIVPPISDDFMTIELLRRDPEALRAFIAKRLFVDFKHAEDEQGNPLTNTPEVRQQILVNARVWLWINDYLAVLALTGDEGKDTSGNA